MPELQMDVVVANRFISTLSTFLLALCRGCMDFDSGLEIVGYININIDCGSKVDFVLNEKVLKSPTNSVTIVSNSFLARKEQPKQTRDGTCSPVPELISPLVMSPIRGFLHGMHPRNVGPVSHHNMHRDAQKRSWAGMERDWRMSPKKQRDGRPFYPSAHESGSTAQFAHSSPSSSSHPADAEFKYPQSSFQGSDTNAVENQSEVNIKMEFLENDCDRETDQNEQDQSQTFDQSTNDNSDQVSDVANIKRDPDASSADVDDETPATDRSVNEPDDYKDTFLEPSTSEDNQAVSEHSRHDSGAHDDSQTISRGLAPETSAEVGPPDNAATGSEMQGEYDEAGERSYPHFVYSDTIEGSSDTGQFQDVENEDVQVMFRGSRFYAQGCSRLKLSASSSFGTSQKSFHHMSSHSQPVLQDTSLLHTAEDAQGAQAMPDSLVLLVAMDQDKPNCCHLCSKGFLSSTGFNLQAHEGQRFMCPVCHSKFNQKVHVKTHLKGVHKLAQCVTCSELLGLGAEYNQHVLHCHTNY